MMIDGIHWLTPCECGNQETFEIIKYDSRYQLDGISFMKYSQPLTDAQLDYTDKDCAPVWTPDGRYAAAMPWLIDTRHARAISLYCDDFDKSVCRITSPCFRARGSICSSRSSLVSAFPSKASRSGACRSWVRLRRARLISSI